jgi:nitroreductase
MKTETDVLKLIKETSIVRRFTDADVPDELIDKILEAGNWSFSVMGIQPWSFVCIKSKKNINNIADIMINNSKNIPRAFSIIANLTAQTIKNANALIAVYNNKKVSSRAVKYGKDYLKRVYIAEVQAIGGVMQNMCLEAASLGLGFVWADSPAFFDKEINQLLGENKELLAFLVIGYPNQKSVRTKRSTDIKLIKRF